MTEPQKSKIDIDYGYEYDPMMIPPEMTPSILSKAANDFAKGVIDNDQYTQIRQLCLDVIDNYEHEYKERYIGAETPIPRDDVPMPSEEAMKQLEDAQKVLSGTDMVNHPPHYKSADGSGIECMDAMRAMCTMEEYHGYLKCQVLKYMWRAGRKDKSKTEEDLEKARFYLNKLVEEASCEG